MDNSPHYKFKSKWHVFEEHIFLVLFLTKVKEYILQDEFGHGGVGMLGTGTWFVLLKSYPPQMSAALSMTKADL